MATPGAGSNSCGGVSGIIPHIDSQPPLGTTELGMTSNTSGGGTDAISSGGQAGDRGSCSADSGVRGSSDRESGGATSIGGNLSGSTTDVLSANEEQSNDTSLQTSQPWWLRSNASSQMHRQNSSSWWRRTQGRLQRGSEASIILRGESRDVVPSTSSSYVAALKDNGATSNSDLASGGMINSNNNGSSSASSGIGSTNPCQEGNESQTHAQEDGKRLRTVLIAARLRREVRPATSRPIGRKDRSSPIDRKSNPVETRNSSPCGSPGEKTRRSCALNRDKTRLGESRSRSVSPDRGSSNRTSFLHRDCSDLSGIERLRISTNPDSFRSRRFCRVTDVRKEIADNDVRPEEENEPGPGSRPASAANSLWVCDDSVGAKLRRLLLTGEARGEVGTEDAALKEEARFVALEMELQHAREALHALKADRKRLKIARELSTNADERVLLQTK
ncbi:kazrin isoform X1 [Vespula squamosa]|uniref:Kazrin isoform X1 n=1 Tax=Vespula squamosa TaxID=30214 RepID=A0ABD2BHD4_VESSQ